MEQQPPSRSTPPRPPTGGANPAPSGAAPAKAPAARPPAAADAPAATVVLVCPICNEARAEDARYCEECGHDFGTAAPADVTLARDERTGLSGPLLWLVLVFWVALALGGLFFLYTALWTI